jgi:hypothetical protein
VEGDGYGKARQRTEEENRQKIKKRPHIIPTPTKHDAKAEELKTTIKPNQNFTPKKSPGISRPKKKPSLTKTKTKTNPRTLPGVHLKSKVRQCKTKDKHSTDKPNRPTKSVEETTTRKQLQTLTDSKKTERKKGKR